MPGDQPEEETGYWQSWLSVIASVQVMMYAFSEAMQGGDQHHDILGCPTSITPMWENVLPSADDGLVCSFPVHWFCFTKAGWSKQLVDDMAGEVPYADLKALDICITTSLPKRKYR